MTLIIFFLLGYVSAIVYEYLMERVGQKIKRIKGHKVNNGLVINGYLLHHSIYGLLFLLAALLISDQRLQLFAFGVGIITQHYFTGDGLVFITKKR